MEPMECADYSDCASCAASDSCNWDLGSNGEEGTGCLETGGVLGEVGTCAGRGANCTSATQSCPNNDKSYYAGSCRFRCGVVGDARFDKNTQAVAWRGGPFWGGQGGWFNGLRAMPNRNYQRFNPFWRDGEEFASEDKVTGEESSAQKQFSAPRFGGRSFGSFVRPPVHGNARVAEKKCSCDQACTRMEDCCEDYYDMCRPNVKGEVDHSDDHNNDNIHPNAPNRNNMCRWRCNCNRNNGGFRNNGRRCGFFDRQCNSC